MTWTTPRVWPAGELVTAALLNTHVRDNLLEVAPAKATAAGDLFYATGAGAVARLVKGSDGDLLSLGAGVPMWLSQLTRVWKPSDETVVSSTTFQNDDHLLFAVAANEIWAFALTLLIDQTSTSAHIKIRFNAPTGAAGGWVNLGNSSAGSYGGAYVPFGTGADFSAPFGIYPVRYLRGYIANGGTAGNVQLQWAQNTSHTSSTTVKRGSFLDVRQIA